MNFADFSATYPGMAGTVDGLDQDAVNNKSAFMEIQQQAAAAGLAMPHHQAYSSIRSSYSAQGAQAAHDAFAAAGQPTRSLGAYSFAAMNNSPLHNTYSHHTGHPYLSTYPTNVTTCAPCPSPPRDGKFLTFSCVQFYYMPIIYTYISPHQSVSPESFNYDIIIIITLCHFVSL